jgi:hypothetical protein
MPRRVIQPLLARAEISCAPLLFLAFAHLVDSLRSTEHPLGRRTKTLKTTRTAEGQSAGLSDYQYLGAGPVTENVETWLERLI